MPGYFRISCAFNELLSHLKPTVLALCLVGALLASQSDAAYNMENLDRGVVAVAQSRGVFISWRWLAWYWSDKASL